jgi:hypothetical protein
MRTTTLSLLFLMAGLFFLQTPLEGQIKIKKPKINLNKEGGKLLDKVFGEEEEESSGNDPSTMSGNPQKGKKLTPPDVNEHLDNAVASLNTQQYSATRYEIQQALMGIELEIGYKVLELLPQEVNGMSYEPENDQVVSNGAGFVGLAIGREYPGRDKSIGAGVFNNSTLMAFYSGLLTNSNYSSNQGDHKAVTVQGFRGALTFDGNSKYELGIPIGQETLFLLTCNGFADENEVLNAANQYPLEKIKELLGEQ